MRVIAGPEKKSRLFSEKRQKITAYHEMGRARRLLPRGHRRGAQISIVSRGQALGYTISLPAEDRYLTTGHADGPGGDDARRPCGGGSSSSTR